MMKILGKIYWQLSRDDSKVQFAIEWQRGVAGWRQDEVQRLRRYMPSEAIVDDRAMALRDSQRITLLTPWQLVLSTIALTNPLNRFPASEIILMDARAARTRSALAATQCSWSRPFAPHLVATPRTQNDYGYGRFRRIREPKTEKAPTN